jgi:hypothetical protein
MPPGAWPAFEKRLAETLGALEEDQYLVVSAKRTSAFVQFAAHGSYGLLAECVGNNYLDGAHALSRRQESLLRRMGWSAPTGTPQEVRAKLVGVQADERLLDRLNELNAGSVLARHFTTEGRLIIAVEMLATPFVAANVSAACLQLGSLADEVGGTLQKEFGGKRAFDEEKEGEGVQ